MRKVGSDLAKQIRNQAFSQQQQSFETLGNLNTNFATLSAQITESQIAENRAIADSAAQIAMSNAQRVQSDAQNFANFTNVVQQGLQQQQQFQLADQQAKAEQAKILQEMQEAELARQQEQQFVDAFTDINALTTQADTLIRQTSDKQFIQAGFDLIAKYPNLKQEDRVKLIDRLYSSTGRVNQDLFNHTEKKQEEIHNQITAAKQAELKALLSNNNARLRTGNFTDINEILENSDGIIGQFLQNNPDLTTVQQLQIYAQNLDYLADNTEAGLVYKNELKQKSQSYAAMMADPRFVENVEKYRRGEISANEWQFWMNTVASEYGVAIEQAQSLGNPLATESAMLAREQVRSQLQALHNQGIAKDISMTDIDNATISYMAWSIANDPQARYELESIEGMTDNPDYKTALELSQNIKEYQETETSVNRNIAKLQKALASWNTSTIKSARSVNDARRQTTDLMRILTESIGADANEVVGNLPEQDTTESDREYILRLTEWAQVGADAIQHEIATEKRRLVPMARRLQQYQLLDATRTNDGRMVENRLQNLMDTIQKTSESAPTTAVPGGTQPNFNQGSTPTPSPVKFATVTNARTGQPMLTPFREGTTGIQFRHSRGRAGDEHAGFRRRDHAGIDIIAPVGTEIIAYMDGEIHRVANDPQGYGYYVDIKTATGTIHRFSHMKNPAQFRVGDPIRVGDVIGKVGKTGNAGNTPPHVHWEMRRAGGREFGFDGTIDIDSVATDLHNSFTGKKPKYDNTQNYQNLPNPYNNDVADNFRNSVSPTNSLLMQSGNYIMNNTMYKIGGVDSQPAQQVYNMANPYRPKFTPNTKEGWTPEQNKPTNNYGYAILARNPSWAKKLNEVATRLGVPGYWLADMIAFESGFDPSIDNGVGYSGLIQFGDGAAKDVGTTRAALRKMTFEQQMEYVYRYFKLPWFGTLDRIELFHAAVWGGPGLVKRARNNPRGALKVSDGWITWDKYLKRLGEGAGRQYSFPFMDGREPKPIHPKFVPGCPICEQLSRSNSFVVHEAQ